MIYMVDMALLDTARRAEWDAWYVAHQHRLLALPGFRASQRFEAVHPADAPFVALHQVDGPDVFETPEYRAQAGPTNTGEWRTRMGNSTSGRGRRRARVARGHDHGHHHGIAAG